MKKTGVFVIGIVDELLFHGNLSKEIINVKLNNLKKNYDCELEHFDYNNSSFDDLIDYINFKDYEYLIFIVSKKTQRILSIINLIKENIPHLEEILILQDDNIYIDENIPDIDSIFETGSNAFSTGIYDSLGIRPYLIKHINIKNCENNASNLDESIILNCAINSTFITKEPEKWDQYPLIKIKPENYLKEEYLKINKEKLNQIIKDFSEKGELPEDYNKIKGIGNIYGLNRLNSISILGDSIYLDDDENISLGSINDSFLLLKNQYTLQNQNLNTSKLEIDTVRYIHLIMPINTSSEYKNSRFILPVTKYKISPKIIDDCDKTFIEWIGIEKNGEYFMYNFVKGRLFKVDRNFMEEFELILKNEDVDNNANEVRTLLEKV